MSGATPVSILQNDYRLALQSADVGSIVLVIDSPGGTVSGISAAHDMIAAGAKQKATIAHIAGSAASAAYWIASAATEIAADRTGVVGSIGVVAALSKQVGPDSDGHVDIEIVSSNAPSKRPDPTSEEGVSEIRAMLDALETQFIADVARSRGVTTAKVKADFGRGGVKIGADAKAAGMIDKVTSFDWTMRAAQLAAKKWKAQKQSQSALWRL